MNVLSFICLFSLTTLSLAADKISGEEFREITTVTGVASDQQGNCLANRPRLNMRELGQDYRFLVKNKKFDEADYDLSPHWQCIFLKRNIKRDKNFSYVPAFKVFSDFSKVSDREQEISGTLNYMGLIPKKYRYRIAISEGVLTATVKIHFMNENLLEEDWRSLDDKLNEAASIWKESLEETFRFNFNFVRVLKPEEAHFSVKVTKALSRGPYDKKWSTGWSSRTIAHEVGHMMGLEDEYDNITFTLFHRANAFLTKWDRRFRHHSMDIENYSKAKNRKCDNTSLMCRSGEGMVKKMHYYLIFGRLFREQK